MWRRDYTLCKESGGVIETDDPTLDNSSTISKFNTGNTIKDLEFES